MLKKLLHGIAPICFVAVCTSPPIAAQQPPTPAPTIRVQSSLVLVDVITQDRKTGLAIRDFRKDDFRLFDNRREVPITSFDAGALYDTRAITLWLVVICNEGGLPKLGASAEFLGQESLFRPALNHLELRDGVNTSNWSLGFRVWPTVSRQLANGSLNVRTRPKNGQGMDCRGEGRA